MNYVKGKNGNRTYVPTPMKPLEPYAASEEEIELLTKDAVSSYRERVSCEDDLSKRVGDFPVETELNFE